MDVANDLASRWDAGFLGDRFPVVFAALDAGEAILDGAFVGLGPGLLAEVLDRADEEAPPFTFRECWQPIAALSLELRS